MRLATASAAALLLWASPATASIPIPVRITCPTDGRTVETYEYAAYSTWGERPDGKPYGSAGFPLPLVECADGLVMYEREFGPEDVERLRPLIASPEYAALRSGGHTPYYRAYWLMRRMGQPAREQIWMLVQAIWETDGSPGLRRVYLEELVERALEVGRADDLIGLALRGRTINALRELGRFDEAAAMLRATSFDVPAENADAAADRSAWRRYYRRLARVVARRDASIEPADMIPREVQRRRRRGWDADD